MERQAALPAPMGALLGRDAELALLTELIDDHALITLTGPPGVGKSRLAVAAAAGRSSDEVAFLDLAPVRDPDLVAPEVAAALAPAQAATGGPLDRLAGVLAGRRLLLVLDNVEHLLPSAARTIADLLARAPGLTVLATSRERLRLRAERELPVPPLALPGPAERADPALLAGTPAVALLVDRVRAFDPGFTVTTDNQEALAGICARLDGLPLALELAAPRLRLFSPGEMLFRLRSRATRLASDAVDVPDRHRTLTSALSWSHDLLRPAERAVFRRLSVFVGGWTLEAATRVHAADDAEAVIASLADKSLIRRVEGPGGSARFGMLESLREFAGDLLERSGELDEIRDRHAGYFAELAVAIERRVGTADERSVIGEVGLEVGNLRAALAHRLATGRPGHGLAIASALGWYCYTRGQLGEGQAMLEGVLAATARGSRPPDDEALAAALVAAGVIALARGDVDTAEERLSRGLTLSEGFGSVRLRGIGTAFLGHVARARERPVQAAARYEEAGRLYELLGYAGGVAWSRYDLGLLARRGRDPRRAATLLRESLRSFRALHHEWATGCAAWALATVEVGLGRDHEAAVLLQEALTAFAAIEDVRGMAQCLEATAVVAAHRRDPTTAARLLGAAAAARDEVAAPLPPEEQGAVGAVRLRTRHELGAEAAADAEQAGRGLPRSAALALARQVLDLPAERVPVPVQGPLTPRETQVAVLVREGCTNRQIGRRLGISEKTTEVHVHNVMRKLGAGSRAEVAAWVAARPGRPGPLHGSPDTAHLPAGRRPAATPRTGRGGETGGIP